MRLPGEPPAKRALGKGSEGEQREGQGPSGRSPRATEVKELEARLQKSCGPQKGSGFYFKCDEPPLEGSEQGRAVTGVGFYKDEWGAVESRSREISKGRVMPGGNKMGK